jgi:hypothetical protein
MKNINTFKLATAILCLTVINSCICENAQNQSPNTYDVKKKIVKLPNLGFVKNPSEEIKKQFPMCDDFLNVEWLDKENGFGYVEHDLYKDGKMIEPKKSIVYIHGNQVDHLFDLNRYEKYGQLEKVLETIKKGKKAYSNFATIPLPEYNGFTVFLEHDEDPDGTYADNHQNVCIPYPDNKKIWLVEGRQVGKVYSQSQIDKYFPEIKKIYPVYKLEWFLRPYVLDINHDGIDDFYSTESFTFSHESSYKSIVKLGYSSDSKGEFFNFGIKDTDRVCKVYDYRPGGFITTDGKSYFLSNQCNLTQLSNY